MNTNLLLTDTEIVKECVLYRSNTTNNTWFTVCEKEIEYIQDTSFINESLNDFYLFWMWTFIINFTIIFIILFMRYSKQTYEKLKNIFS